MAAAAPAAKPESPPSKKGGLLPMLMVAVVAAGAAGGGMFFMQSKGGGAAHAPAEGEGDSHGGGHEAKAESHDSGHGGGHDGAPAEGAAQYLPLTPAIVVNLNDNVTMRYLQVDIELMTRSGAGVDAAKLHMPRIRNTLMMLFTQQRYEDIVTREGKEKLQRDALAAVQAVLKEETGKNGIESLYFTNFVMQ